MSRLERFTLACMLVAFAVVAQAQAPNDNWANRTIIPLLPTQIVEPQPWNSTLEATDLDPPCRLEAQFSPMSNTLWYGYTTGAATEFVSIGFTSPFYPPIVTVYAGTPGAFRVVSGACSSYSGFGLPQLSGIRLEPNTAYSIQVGAIQAVGPGDTYTVSFTASPVYTVTKTADTLDGSCDALDCSLREAIGASNGAPGAVLVPAGHYTLTRAGSAEDNNATGDLDVIGSMGVYGAGMALTIIDAGGIDRVMDLFHVPQRFGGAALGDLTLTGGAAPIIGAFEFGGGLRTNFVAGDFFGLERVAISASSSRDRGGGAHLSAPGTVRDTRITGNTSTDGGGVSYRCDGQVNHPLLISGSTIDANHATGSGGGLYTFGPVVIESSTISGNHGDGSGGGATVLDSNGRLSLYSSSVVFNQGSTLSGTTHTGGGLRLETQRANTLIDSVIAGNSVANPADPPDCSLTAGSIGGHHNHVQQPDTCVFAGVGDVVGTDPALDAALADHGGATPTHALLLGSVAIDAGDPAGCKDHTGAQLAFDQRGAGFPRQRGAACDKGAYETATDPVFQNGFE